MFLRSEKPKQLQPWKLTVQKAICKYKSAYGQPDPYEWSNLRFQHWYDRNIAVISGSTFANELEDKVDLALDAAAARQYYDDDGVLKRTALLTLDGLGQGHDKVLHNKILSDNQYFIAYFDRFMASADKEFKACLVEAAQKIYQLREQESQESKEKNPRGIDENGSAMAAAFIEYDDTAESFQCTLTNIGDTMIVILGSNGLIKDIISARKYAVKQDRDSITYCSIPIHLAAHNPEALQTQTVAVAPGDFIIQMTEGVFNELQLSNQETTIEHKQEFKHHPQQKLKSAVKQCDTLADKSALQLLFNKVTDQKNTHSSHSIASLFIEHIQEKIAKERAENRKNMDQFTQWKRKYYVKLIAYAGEYVTSKDKDSYTFHHLKEKFATDAAYEEIERELQSHFAFLQKNSPTLNQFKNLSDVRLVDFIQYANKTHLFAGDDATVAVMKVANPQVELIRAMLDFPEQRAKIVPRIAKVLAQQHNDDKSFDSDAWFMRIKNHLTMERRIAGGSRGKPLEIPRHSIYRDPHFVALNDFIQTAKQQALALRLESKSTPLSTKQRNKEYLQFITTHEFIRSKYCCGFGTRNTTSWNNTLMQIQKDAIKQLEHEVATLPYFIDQIALLDEALSMPIFREPQNNSILRSALGNTSTIQKIMRLKISLKRQSAPSSDELHYPLLR